MCLAPRQGNGTAGISFDDVSLSDKDIPILIENCAFEGCNAGVFVNARVNNKVNSPQPVANIVIRNNTLIGCGEGVLLVGAPRRILVVGNRLQGCEVSAIDLRDILPGAENVLVANNTMHRNRNALQVWDDSTKKEPGLMCKNFSFQNNLVLEPLMTADLFFFDHRRGEPGGLEKGGDVQALLSAWHFSHNWRDIAPPAPDDVNFPFWIPGPRDTLVKPIEVLSIKPGDADFLRPRKDFPLADAGAGAVNETSRYFDLPPYVGAVPPVGVEPWDWEKTWKALSRTKAK